MQSSTANSSEDGTTPGGRTPKWTVRRACLECQDDKSSLKLTWNRRPWLCCSHPDQDVCKLYCFAEGYDFFFALASKVHDGTPCNQDSSNVCIDGLCEVMLMKITERGQEVVFCEWLSIVFPQRVGCDRVLGSTAVPDTCGVCKGNNSTCKIYKGQYTKQHYTNRTTYSRFHFKDLQRDLELFFSVFLFFAVSQSITEWSPSQWGLEVYV